MNQQEQSELGEKPLPGQSKNTKSEAITNALLIGVMIGVVVWSVAKNTVGLFTLIPLYFIYKLLNKQKDDKAVEEQ